MYVVVTDVIESATEPDPVNVVQLDAPEGTFVVSAFGNLAGNDPDYGLSFLGASSIVHSTSVPGSHQLVHDGEGRVTGVIFFGVYGPDLQVGIVCVS